jgi:DNA-binding response OmpR family regulator
MSRKILVADDEPKIIQIVSAYLESSGFEVLSAKSGDEALTRFKKGSPDCIVLDINMPGMDGLDVARAIRKVSDAPIIFLTARVDETDRIVGLELGADDYIVKPFSPRELVARIKAVLRRYKPQSARDSGAQSSHDSAPTFLRCGEVSVDLLKHIVTVRDEQKTVTKVQFDLLKVLISEPGRVFSRTALLEAALETDFEGYERTIDAHIKNLRKVLGDDGEKSRFIGTVRGVGYKFLEGRDEN